jgi:hypothetical protein
VHVNKGSGTYRPDDVDALLPLVDRFLAAALGFRVYAIGGWKKRTHMYSGGESRREGGSEGKEGAENQSSTTSNAVQRMAAGRSAAACARPIPFI